MNNPLEQEMIDAAQASLEIVAQMTVQEVMWVMAFMAVENPALFDRARIRYNDEMQSEMPNNAENNAVEHTKKEE